MIELVGWATHQHYKERHAPWVKQYVKLLDDPTYRCLSHGARSLLNDLWMLGPTTRDGVIRTIGGKPCASTTLAWLLREDAESVAGWLVEVAAVRDENDAPRWIILHGDNGLRPMLAPCKQNTSATSPPEGETETEGETDLLLSAFTDKAHRDAVEAAIAGPRARRLAVTATLRALHDGTHRTYPWAVIGRALVELQAEGTTFNANSLDGFCRRILAGDSPPRARGAPRQTQREKSLAVCDAELSREDVA